MGALFMNLNKTNGLFQTGQDHLASDFTAVQYSTSLYKALNACFRGFSSTEVSSSLAGKYKYIVSERDSVMYLSTFSFQFGSVNSQDE